MSVLLWHAAPAEEQKSQSKAAYVPLILVLYVELSQWQSWFVEYVSCALAATMQW